MVSSSKSSGKVASLGREVPPDQVRSVLATQLDEAIRVAKSAFAAVEAVGALIEQLRGCQLDHDTLASIFELIERQHVDLQMCLAEMRTEISGAQASSPSAAERVVPPLRPTDASMVLFGDDTSEVDELSRITAQLTSLLHLTYGFGGETFRSYSDAIQDSTLWLCSDLAERCRALANKVEWRREETRHA